jgi:serine/threonine protein kinase
LNENNEPFTPGHRFVKYDIIGLLGMGGHAHVYDAHDPFLDRDVALKVIRAPKGARHNLAKRAQSEARVLVRIDHPNVVKVFDAGATDDGLVYLVMEKLEGRTLREVYQDVGRVSVVEALELATQICAGVHAAHQMDVIHRDLKPENVFVQANNRVKVLDFGISKVMGYGAHDTTQRHMLHGTVLYMSPEHLQGFGVTRKSDVFSLGTLLYEGLHAHPVLLSPNALAKDVRELRDMRQVIYSQLKELPPMLHEVDARIFRHVARFVQRAILKASEQRYETMAAMLEAARQASERIEREEGAEFIARARRDLSRPQRRSERPPRGDTVQVAMRFSTEIEPVRYATQPGGLTPPVPLSVTTPLEEHVSGLPFQTTTPVPVPPGSVRSPSSRPPSARPVVVVPPLNARAKIVEGAVKLGAPTPDGREVPTESLLQESLLQESLLQTAAQSATLALAEQVTRTASVDRSVVSGVDSDQVIETPRSPGHEVRPSVVPVSRTSGRATAANAASRASSSGVLRPWRKRLSARVVLATGAALGLLLGIGFSIASMRAPVSSIQPTATTTDGLVLGADAPPSASTKVAHGSALSGVGPLPVRPKAEPTAPATTARTGIRKPAAAAQRPNTAARSSVDAMSGEHATDRADSTKQRPRSAASTPAKAAESEAASAAPPEQGQEPGSWLKPEMIHFPDELPPNSPRSKPDRMPSSGLD